MTQVPNPKSKKPTKKEIEAEFDKLARFLYDMYRKKKQKEASDDNVKR